MGTRKMLFLASLMALIAVVGAFAQDVTLQWWSWDVELKAQNEAIIQKFQAANPGIKVELSTMSTSEYWTKIRLLANQKKLPDVFEMSSGYVEEWAKEKLLLDLGPYIDQSVKNAFYMSVFDAGKEIAGQGKYVALPFALVTTVLFYNQDMFDKAGIAYPSDKWTWEDFRSAAKKLTLDTNKDGTTDQWGFWFYGRYAHIEPWVFANDGDLIDRSNMTYKPDAKAMEAIRFLTDLVLKDKCAPSLKAMSAFRQQDVFPQGVAAMWVDGSWNIDNTRTVAPKTMRWSIADIPAGPSGTKKYVNGWPDYIALSPFTKNADAAWKFAKFIAGEGLDMKMYMAGKIPTYKSLAESPSFMEKGLLPTNKDLLIKQAAKTFKTSYTLGWSEWRGYGAAENLGFNGVIDGIINGDIAFDKGMETADKNVNKILSRYYK